MKLRNRKTGEIGGLSTSAGSTYVVLDDNGVALGNYRTLKELCSEWGDYEEPKEHWEILAMGNVIKMTDAGTYELQQEIGNYFETKEEAEKAVEKLKAWKRLKDKGFRFSKWTIPEEPKTPHIKLMLEAEMDVPNSPYDLDLLFNTEED